MTPARWLVLTVRVPSAESRDALTEGLFALGGTAVEEDVDLLTTFVGEPRDLKPFLSEAVRRLESVADAPVEMLWRWQDDEDWSTRWKEGLSPREAGRITITQPWNPVEERGDRIVISIDPSNAFGTGEHATTRGALRLMQGHVPAGANVLDVGTGSGVLAIAAIRLGAERVLAVESDGDALESAAGNLDRNGVSGIRLEHAVVDGAYLDRLGRSFDMVTANVLSGVLSPLLPSLARVTRPGGRVILGGIMITEAEAIADAARAAGLTLAAEDREGEWWTGRFQRSPVASDGPSASERASAEDSARARPY